MEYFGFILLSIVILLVMVLIHELGHYIAAKILDFSVDEFSVGFGPKLLSRRRKNGELISLRALPLGGYCAFTGDNEDEDQKEISEPKNDSSCDVFDTVSTTAQPSASDDLLTKAMTSEIDDKNNATETKPIRLDKFGNPVKTFYSQKAWKRIIVLLGGVTFNFLSAIVFSLIYIWCVGFPVPVVAEVYAAPDGSDYCALEYGDVILSVNGTDIDIMHSFGDLTANTEQGQTVTFDVNRNGTIVSVKAVKREIKYIDSEAQERSYVGFGMVTGTMFTGNTAGQAFKYCVPYTLKLSWSILGSFGKMITGDVPITSITGPVGSVKLMADVSAANKKNVLVLLPLLAGNLAVFNLLPFPALDGAQIIFTIVEWIRKKPIKRKVQGMINAIGLAALLFFVLLVDILSFAL